MATTVTIETDKALPPKGSSRLHRLEADIQTVVQVDLGDSTVTVKLIKRK